MEDLAYLTNSVSDVVEGGKEYEQSLSHQDFLQKLSWSLIRMYFFVTKFWGKVTPQINICHLSQWMLGFLQ